MMSCRDFNVPGTHEQLDTMPVFKIRYINEEVQKVQTMYTWESIQFVVSGFYLSEIDYW